MVIKIDIFHSQAHGFHDAQPAAIHHLGDQLVRADKIGQEAFDFFPRENGRDDFGTLRAKFGQGEFIEFDVQDVTIEKHAKRGAEGLVSLAPPARAGVSGRRHFIARDKMRQELPNFGYAHFFGMAFVMKKDIVSYPESIGVFGARGVAFDAQGIAVLIEKSFAIGR